MKIFTRKQRLLVFCITLAVIGVFALLGYLVGRAVHSIGLAVAIAVVVSYPFSLWTLARVLKRQNSSQPKQEEDSVNKDI